MSASAITRCLVFIVLLTGLLTRLTAHADLRIGHPHYEVIRTSLAGGRLSAFDVAVRPDGMVFIGTRTGLATFDGERWTELEASDVSTIRSIALAGDGRIFVGQRHDIGVFEAGRDQTLVYRSLRGDFGANRVRMGQCRQIIIFDNTVYFSCASGIAVWPLAGNQAGPEFVPVATQIFSLSLVRGRLLAAIKGRGIEEFRDRRFVPLVPGGAGAKNFPTGDIVGCCALGTSDVLVASHEAGMTLIREDGYQPFSAPVSERGKELVVVGLNRLGPDRYLFTSRAGVCLFNAAGEILSEINSGRGDGIGTCRNRAFVDHEGTIWVPMTHSGPLAKIDLQSGARRFDVSQEQEVTWLKQQDDVLYVAAGNSVLRVGESPDGAHSDIPTPLPLKTGVSRGSVLVGDQLLFATDHGLGCLCGGRQAVIGPDCRLTTGVYLPERDRVVFGAVNDSLQVYRREGNTWVHDTEIRGTPERSFHLIYDDQRDLIWFSVGVGLGRFVVHALPLSDADLTADLSKRITRYEAMARHVGGQLALWNGTALYNTVDGLQQFDPVAQTFVKFVPPSTVAEFSTEWMCATIAVDMSGRLWLATLQNELLRITPDGQVDWPRGLLDDEVVSRIFGAAESGAVWIRTTGNRLIRLPVDLPKTGEPGPTRITRITKRTVDNQIAEIVPGHPNHPIRLRSAGLIFQYASQSIARHANLPYQYRLIGLDDAWSEWTADSEQQYHSLAQGAYVFEVRSRARNFQVGHADRFSFMILEPWYRTWTAWGGFGAVALMLTGGTVWWRTWHVRKRVEYLERVVSDRTSELQAARDSLEVRVLERTEDLQRLNQQLNREVSEHLQTSQQLSESELRYRSIVEDQTEMVIRFQPDGTLTFANRAYRERHQIVCGQEETFNVFSAIHPDERQRIIRKLREATQGERVSFVRLRVLRGDGTIDWADWHGRALLDHAGNLQGYQGVGRVVTDLVDASARLEEKENQLAHLARVSALGEMVAGISHEINQPLATIANFASASQLVLQKDSADESDLKKLRTWAGRMAHQTERINGIIQRLRRLGRPGSQRERFRMSAAVTEALLVMATRTRHVIDVIEVECPDTLPLVNADQVQIEQVLVNLIRNACDAVAKMPVGNRKLTIHAQEIRGYIQVTITDSGPGISPDDAGEVFQPFVTSKTEGMGIGLAISRSIIQGHGGTIRAILDSGCGAFEFSLPVADDSPAEDARNE